MIPERGDTILFSIRISSKQANALPSVLAILALLAGTL